LRLAGAIHGPEYVSVSDAGGGCPRIRGYLHPRRHWNRPHAAMLSDEVHDAPPAIALLDVVYVERRYFGPPEAAAQEDR
jgi:hypothetical protein